MDLDKILRQRQAKEAAAEPQAMPRKSTPTPAKESKRQGWKACTFYLRPATKARLERVLLERKLDGAPGAADQSEAIEEALQAWLTEAERKVG
jgi:hypothetical protein